MEEVHYVTPTLESWNNLVDSSTASWEWEGEQYVMWEGGLWRPERSEPIDQLHASESILGML